MHNKYALIFLLYFFEWIFVMQEFWTAVKKVELYY